MRTLASASEHNALRSRLRALQADDPARWGVLDAPGMLRHLTAAFALALDPTPPLLLPVPVPRWALKGIALWVPLPWRRNFETVPALKRDAPGMQPGTFTDEREATVHALDRFCTWPKARPDHAFFGTMSTRDWMRWGFLHTDHHLRQFGR